MRSIEAAIPKSPRVASGSHTNKAARTPAKDAEIDSANETKDWLFPMTAPWRDLSAKNEMFDAENVIAIAIAEVVIKSVNQIAGM